MMGEGGRGMNGVDDTFWKGKRKYDREKESNMEGWGEV